jgi:hypothetical protein
LFVEYLDWCPGASCTSPRLTFSAFKKLYVLNPSKWDLYSSYVVYHPFGNADLKYITVEFKHFRDAIKYMRFHDTLEANEQQLERIKMEKEFLEYMQDDINTFREENIAEMKRILQK